jgi:hypothetical protein
MDGQIQGTWHLKALVSAFGGHCQHVVVSVDTVMMRIAFSNAVLQGHTCSSVDSESTS